MRFFVAAFVVLAIGMGVGLIVFAANLPSYEDVARSYERPARGRDFLQQERHRAEKRAIFLGAGSGLLAAGATALLLYLGAAIGRKLGRGASRLRDEAPPRGTEAG